MESSSNPPAEGVRVHWDELPSDIRAAFEEKLGAHVIESTTQPGGFSPGLAARLRLEDGRRVFLKAVSQAANPHTPDIHRQEARIVAALPASAPVPRLLWTYDEGGWVALCFEDVGGRPPYLPWTESDLALVVASLKKMAADLTPSPIRTTQTATSAFEHSINGWQRALNRGEDRLDPWCLRNLRRLAELEARAPQEAAGNTLLHFDLRADNLIIAGDRVYVVDWPWARLGHTFVDWVAMAPSVVMQGGSDAEGFLQRFAPLGVSADAVDAVVCSLAGYFRVTALDPPPPGIPTVRAFQAAQGAVALGWLRARKGWV